eukprot:TRINITY_DN15962_c0_g1_i1.p1 TRINITY_DN15962_c0_g1~~TRINITY_DN15962_c0_g1_i1.p1  ORF type:complete len:1367 (-),score=384.67 TRINITY_DN15962_c0_g1_i1:67-4167(-)
MEHLLNVHVHAAAGLKFLQKERAADLPSPYVSVEVFGQTIYTEVKRDSSSPEYEASYSIESKIEHDDFMEADVKISIWHKGWLGSELLGAVTFGLQMIYEMPQHKVRKDWFPIALPASPSDIRGFVQLSLGAYSPGDSVPRQALSVGADNGEADKGLKSRVVELPSVNADEIALYQLIVRIFRAEGLQALSGLFGESCSPYVEVEFNGTLQSTQVKYSERSPIWNQEIQVPFNMPTWDDSVSVNVRTGGTKIGDVDLSIKALGEKMQAPAWFNFWSSAEVKTGVIASEDGAECEYSGRLLLGACVTRVEVPILHVGELTRQDPPPVNTQSTLRVDFFEVCFDDVEDLKLEQCIVRVSLPPMVQELESVESEKHGEATFVWDHDSGRLQEETFPMPPPDQAADLLLTVWLLSPGLWGVKQERHMFCRVPVADIYETEYEPKWLEMELVKKNEDSLKNGGYLLCALNINPTMSMPERPKRETIFYRKFLFRALLYQAVNLPAADPSGTSDTFVVVYFGSATLRSSVYSGSLNPTWNQILEAEVELPYNDTLRPSIKLYVLDMDDEDCDPLAMLRVDTEDPIALPRKNNSPKWLDLMPAPGGPITQGKILVGFELMPAEKAHERTSIAPPVEECRIELFIIGVRIMDHKDLGKPYLEIAWGRKDKHESHLWETPAKKRTAGPGIGSKGKYNFMEKVVLSPCKLASHPAWQEWLEVKLLCDSEATEDEKDVFCGAAIHLTPELPFIEAEKRQKAAQAYRCKRVSEIMRDDRAKQNGEGGDTSEEEVEDEEEEEDVLTAAKKRKIETVIQEKEQQLAKGLGWDFEDVTSSNVMAEEIHEYTCVTDKQIGQFEEAQELQIAMADAPEDENEAGTRKVIKNFQKSFQWPRSQGGHEGYGDHFDIDDELERGRHLSAGGLPYRKTALFVSDEDTKAQRVVGSLKYIIRVVKKSDYKNGGPDMERENAAFEDKCQFIQEEFRKAKDLDIRIYILGADGLVPPSGTNDATTYVWTAVGPQDDLALNFRDSGTCRHHSVFPEFNSMHLFSRCDFPRCTYLKVAMVEKEPALLLALGGLQDPKETVVGNTLVDLEDRWFHSRYRKMVQDKGTPIEARRLFRGESVYGRGHVRLWVDILFGHQQSELPPQPLPSTQPQKYELRVVIWKMKDIITIDESVPSVQIIAKIFLDDGTEEIQETDTHKNAADGSATFNWRLIFKQIKIPCRNARLYLTAWNIGYTSSDTICEVILDLTKDFAQAKRTGLEVELPRGSIKMRHVSEPDMVRGVLDLQAILLHSVEAQSRKVGDGREEPNEDPFCDPDDPHLVKGRAIQIPGAAAIAALGNALGMAAKLAFIMKIIYVLGGLLGSAMLTFVLTQN